MVKFENESSISNNSNIKHVEEVFAHLSKNKFGGSTMLRKIHTKTQPDKAFTDSEDEKVKQ